MSRPRPIARPAQLDDAVVALTSRPPSVIPSWKTRLRINAEKLANGTLCDAAEVVRDLTWLQDVEGLGSAEQALCSAARDVVERELSVALDLDRGQARRRLDQLLASALPPSTVASTSSGTAPA